MATGIAAATTDSKTNHFEICPMWINGVCTCTKNSNGDPVTAHQTFSFGAVSPDARTTAQWAASCAKEALLLVKIQTPVQQPLKDVVGLNI